MFDIRARQVLGWQLTYLLSGMWGDRTCHLSALAKPRDVPSRRDVKPEQYYVCGKLRTMFDIRARQLLGWQLTYLLSGVCGDRTCHPSALAKPRDVPSRRDVKPDKYYVYGKLRTMFDIRARQVLGWHLTYLFSGMCGDRTCHPPAPAKPNDEPSRRVVKPDKYCVFMACCAQCLTCAQGKFLGGSSHTCSLACGVIGGTSDA